MGYCRECEGREERKAMTQRKTLGERVFKRSGGVLSAEEAAGNVRAELERVARSDAT